VLTGAVIAVLLVGGCSSEATSDGPTTAVTTSTLEGDITVSAAASLTDVFEAVGDAFVDRHPATSVEFNFGSSGQLATQIVDGAPADVAAFADTTPMQVLEDAGLLAAPAEVFATNELVLVTPPGNPAGIGSLADLAGASTVSLCVATAPCGRFAEQLLSQGGITIEESSVTRGQDVRATLAAVTEGDADAAIVYLSDAEAVGSRVEVVDIPEAVAIVASYPIAVLADSDAVDVAESFLAFVRSDDGQVLLSEAGFGPP
jgi:molybdate transport system substrate-binding protein